MTRGRLPSGSWIEAGGRYRTRDGVVVEVVMVQDTGLRTFDLKGRDAGPAVLITVREPDGGSYAVHHDGRYLSHRRDDRDLIRRAFRNSPARAAADDLSKRPQQKET